MDITIKNWDKYHYRKSEAKKHSWFRLDNTFFEDPVIMELSHEEKAFFVYLLCLGSKKMDGSVKVMHKHATLIGGFQSPEALIKKLESLQLIISSKHTKNTPVVHEKPTKNTLHNITIHNITEQKKNTSPSFDLLDFISKNETKYPKAFMEEQYPICVEWWYAKHGKEPGLRGFSGWLRSAACKKQLAAWKHEHGISPFMDFLAEEAKSFNA